MEEVQMTVEEQDARLTKTTERLDLQLETKRDRARQLEELVEQQREFVLELQETLNRLGEKNQLLRQKK